MEVQGGEHFHKLRVLSQGDVVLTGYGENPLGDSTGALRHDPRGAVGSWTVTKGGCSLAVTTHGPLHLHAKAGLDGPSDIDLIEGSVICAGDSRAVQGETALHEGVLQSSHIQAQGFPQFWPVRPERDGECVILHDDESRKHPQ